MIDRLDDRRVGHSSVSDDGGLDLHSWNRMRGGRTWGWSWGDGLRWRRTRGRRGGEDSGERQSGVLDGQVRREERLGL